MAKNNPALHKQVIQLLKEVYDPELPVNVYDLGLIYDITWSPSTNTIGILMTLTTPNCPAAELLPQNIKEALMSLATVKDVIVSLTFDPPYTVERMSEEAKIILGYHS